MPICPECGGQRADLIAPGYYRCLSRIDDERLCRYEFQIGPPQPAGSPFCQCGLFAVGKCTDCGRWVCGKHSGHDQDKLLCTDCLAARHEADGEAASDRKQQFREGIDAFVSVMNGASNLGAEKYWRTLDWKVWLLGKEEMPGREGPSLVDYFLATDGDLIYVMAGSREQEPRRPSPNFRPAKEPSPQRENLLGTPGKWLDPDGREFGSGATLTASRLEQLLVDHGLRLPDEAVGIEAMREAAVGIEEAGSWIL